MKTLGLETDTLGHFDYARQFTLRDNHFPEVAKPSTLAESPGADQFGRISSKLIIPTHCCSEIVFTQPYHIMPYQCWYRARWIHHPQPVALHQLKAFT